MHRLRARLRGERGFTFVELLVSMLLLGGGIFAAVGAFGDSVNGAATAQQIDVATARGTQVLEEMRAAPYDQIAVQNVAGAPPMTDGDPRERLNGNDTKYKVASGGPNEEVVAASAGSQFKNVETVTVGGQTMRIYRFVSWRDEECPILDLTALESTVTQLTSLLGVTTGLLGGLTGPAGSLTGATTDGNSLLGDTLLGTLLSPVTQLVTAVLQPLTSELTPLLPSLQGLLSTLNEIRDPVTQHITGLLDLCDIPSGILPDVGQLAVISSTLALVNPILETIAPLIDTVAEALHDLLDLNIFNVAVKLLVNSPKILGALPTLLVQAPALINVLGDVVDTVGNPTTLVALATSAVTGLEKLLEFLANPNTTHNTKRISVAVWLQDRKVGYGPNKPIWLSTVVTDPNEGLL